MLLKADHRQVSDWFAQFKKTAKESRRIALARDICRALRLHTLIEEEIFYPAFLPGTRDKDIHHEAEVDHQAAKELLAEIEKMTPADDYFAAKVNVKEEKTRAACSPKLAKPQWIRSLWAHASLRANPNSNPNRRPLEESTARDADEQ